MTMNKTKKKSKYKKLRAVDTWVPDSERRYAAIDIGSNGVRLLLSKVITSGKYITFTKESLVRMPIRLGDDVFTTEAISDHKADQLISTMKAFHHLVEAYAPDDTRACATSAMREATNGDALAQRIREESGLNLKLIDGGQEAETILASHVADALDPSYAYLYIDVGGGSTELTFLSQGQRVNSQSFPIGTVRILKGLVGRKSWKEMKRWIKIFRPPNIPLHAIGSGGNMNKIFRLAGVPTEAPVSYGKLIEIDELLNQHNLEERIRILHLRPDRADVIIPASQIFRSIMKWGDIKQIFVPQFGLADGLVHVMHDQYLQDRSAELPQVQDP